MTQDNLGRARTMGTKLSFHLRKAKSSGYVKPDAKASPVTPSKKRKGKKS